MNENEGLEAQSSYNNYAGIILGKWIDIGILGENVRKSYLKNTPELETLYEYISKMSRLWIELYPKVKGSREMKDLENDFLEFEKYYLDPELLLMPAPNRDPNSKDVQKELYHEIFKMEMCERMVIEKLKITRFGDEPD